MKWLHHASPPNELGSSPQVIIAIVRNDIDGKADTMMLNLLLIIRSSRRGAAGANARHTRSSRLVQVQPHISVLSML
jgi:hypothetical protein